MNYYIITKFILRTSVFSVLALCSFQSPSLSQSAFVRTYGGPDSDIGISVLITPNGDYIILGTTRSDYTAVSEFWLMKANPMGDIQWTKNFGSGKWSSALGLVPTFDDGYIFVADKFTYDRSRGYSDMYLVKTDSSGDTLWTRLLDKGTRLEWGRSVQQTSDSGYVVLAHAVSNGYNICMIKTNSGGDMLWTKTFSVSGNIYGESIQQTTDNGYIVAGRITISSGYKDLFLQKTDSVGNALWTKTFDAINYQTLLSTVSVKTTPDGGYIFVGGNTRSAYSDTNDVYLVKTDASGDTLWTRTFGGPNEDTPSSMILTSDGGYAIVGWTTSFGAGSSDVYLIKTDSSGDTLWTRTYGGTNDDTGYSVQQTLDGGYIITGGTRNGWFAPEQDLLLIKTDPEGILTHVSTLGNNSVPSITLNQNYPNPFNPTTTISFSLISLSFTTLTIYDVLGRELTTLIAEELQPGTHSIPWDASDLPSGVYYYRLETGSFMQTKKLILLK